MRLNVEGRRRNLFAECPRLLAGLLVLAPLVLGCQRGAEVYQATRAGLSANQDYYYGYQDAQVILTFQPGQVGVVTRERAGRRQVQTVGATFGLQIASEISGGLFVLTGPGLTERSSVLALARNIKARFGTMIRDAGFVVRNAYDDNPMMVTDELLVRFPARTSDDQARKIFSSLAVKPVYRSRGGTWRVSVTSASPFDALAGARYFKEKLAVTLAEPNLHFVAQRFETIPTDPLFASEWQHKNTGLAGGTVDADIDTTLAWDFTQGSSSTIIAIVDNTFDMAHEDLAANVYTNPGEIAGNGIDDDGNGLVDDVHGWDFVSGDNDAGPVSAGDNHGTAVTGVAVAQAGNGVGVSGTCPGCRFLPLTIFNNCAIGSFCATSVGASRELLEALLDRVRSKLSPRGLVLFWRLLVRQEPIETVCAETGLSADAVYAWRSRLGRVARALALDLIDDSDRAGGETPAVRSAARRGQSS